MSESTRCFNCGKRRSYVSVVRYRLATPEEIERAKAIRAEGQGKFERHDLDGADKLWRKADRVAFRAPDDGDGLKAGEYYVTERAKTDELSSKWYGHFHSLRCALEYAEWAIETHNLEPRHTR